MTPENFSQQEGERKVSEKKPFLVEVIRKGSDFINSIIPEKFQKSVIEWLTENVREDLGMESVLDFAKSFQEKIDYRLPENEKQKFEEIAKEYLELRKKTFLVIKILERLKGSKNLKLKFEKFFGNEKIISSEDLWKKPPIFFQSYNGQEIFKVGNNYFRGVEESLEKLKSFNLEFGKILQEIFFGNDQNLKNELAIILYGSSEWADFSQGNMNFAREVIAGKTEATSFSATINFESKKNGSNIEEKEKKEEKDEKKISIVSDIVFSVLESIKTGSFKAEVGSEFGIDDMEIDVPQSIKKNSLTKSLEYANEENMILAIRKNGSVKYIIISGKDSEDEIREKVAFAIFDEQELTAEENFDLSFLEKASNDSEKALNLYLEFRNYLVKIVSIKHLVAPLDQFNLFLEFLKVRKKFVPKSGEFEEIKKYFLSIAEKSSVVAMMEIYTNEENFPSDQELRKPGEHAKEAPLHLKVLVKDDGSSTLVAVSDHHGRDGLQLKNLMKKISEVSAKKGLETSKKTPKTDLSIKNESEYNSHIFKIPKEVIKNLETLREEITVDGKVVSQGFFYPYLFSLAMGGEVAFSVASGEVLTRLVNEVLFSNEEMNSINPEEIQKRLEKLKNDIVSIKSGFFSGNAQKIIESLSFLGFPELSERFFGQQNNGIGFVSKVIKFLANYISRDILEELRSAHLISNIVSILFKDGIQRNVSGEFLISWVSSKFSGITFSPAMQISMNSSIIISGFDEEGNLILSVKSKTDRESAIMKDKIESFFRLISDKIAIENS